MVRPFFLALMTLFAFTLTATGAQAQSATSGATADFTEAELQRIRAEALAAILAYPEIIEEATAILQERRSNAALASVLQDPNTPVLGNPEGEIALIEFFDYNCGYCRRAAGSLRGLIEDDPDLRVIMVEAPILSEESLEASQASVAAYALGADYEELHFAVMGGTGRATGDAVIEYAGEQDIDKDAISEKMETYEVMGSLSQNYGAMQAMEIGGTPAFIVGRYNVDGSLSEIELFPGAVPVEDLKLAIERLRQGS